METPPTPLERRTGRRYTNEAERRLVAWAKANYPRYGGVGPPEDWDPEAECYLADLDGAQYGPIPCPALEAQLQDILAELGA